MTGLRYPGRRIRQACGLAFFLGAACLAHALTDGVPIPVAGGTGPLHARPGVATTPLGVANVAGGGARDLFMTGGLLCKFQSASADGTPTFQAPETFAVPALTSPTLTGTARDYALLRRSNATALKTSAIVQTSGGQIYGIFAQDKTVLCTLYSSANKRFDLAAQQALTLTQPINTLTAYQDSINRLQVVTTLGNGSSYLPAGDPRAAGFIPFDGAGVWLGSLTYEYLQRVRFADLSLGTPQVNAQVSTSTSEILFGAAALDFANWGVGHQRDLVCGSSTGMVYVFPNTQINDLSLQARRPARLENGSVLRHVGSFSAPVSYPNLSTGKTDLLVGHADGLDYYQFTGSFSGDGAPIFKAPTRVLQQQAWLNAGALAVISSGDLNGDGKPDLVAGTASGRLWWMQNNGTVANPAYNAPQAIMAAGQALVVKAGYRGSVQGPAETRLGHLAPVVTDWTGDSLPDILYSTVEADYYLLTNTGTAQVPQFAPPQALYYDGLELHGTWRNQPAITNWGNATGKYLLTFDDTDKLRQFKQVDAHNVTDGGLLLMQDGNPISGNYLFAGGTGRIKLQCVDWDQDGKLDLLAGVDRESAIPAAATGVPHTLPKPAAAVLLLRNVGSNAAPRFAFPALMTHTTKGALFFGTEAASPLAISINGGAPDLIVAEEAGNLMYYARANLRAQRLERSMTQFWNTYQ
jgi:hypothetical protein